MIINIRNGFLNAAAALFLLTMPLVAAETVVLETTAGEKFENVTIEKVSSVGVRFIHDGKSRFIGIADLTEKSLKAAQDAAPIKDNGKADPGIAGNPKDDSGKAKKDLPEAPKPAEDVQPNRILRIEDLEPDPKNEYVVLQLGEHQKDMRWILVPNSKLKETYQQLYDQKLHPEQYRGPGPRVDMFIVANSLNVGLRGSDITTQKRRTLRQAVAPKVGPESAKLIAQRIDLARKDKTAYLSNLNLEIQALGGSLEWEKYLNDRLITDLKGKSRGNVSTLFDTLGNTYWLPESGEDRAICYRHLIEAADGEYHVGKLPYPRLGEIDDLTSKALFEIYAKKIPTMGMGRGLALIAVTRPQDTVKALSMLSQDLHCKAQMVDGLYPDGFAATYAIVGLGVLGRIATGIDMNWKDLPEKRRTELLTALKGTLISSLKSTNLDSVANALRVIIYTGCSIPGTNQGLMDDPDISPYVAALRNDERKLVEFIPKSVDTSKYIYYHVDTRHALWERGTNPVIGKLARQACPKACADADKK